MSDTFKRNMKNGLMGVLTTTALTACAPAVLYQQAPYSEAPQPIPTTPAISTTDTVWQSPLFGTCRSGTRADMQAGVRTSFTTICRPENSPTAAFDGEIRFAKTGFYHMQGQALSATGEVVFACPARGQPINFKHIQSGTYLPEVNLTVPEGCVAVAERIMVGNRTTGFSQVGSSMIIKDTVNRRAIIIQRTPTP